jgi:signal transduction histidine kinase
METGTKLLKVASRLNEKNIEIEIADTGGGISKEKIKNIFDPMVTSKVYGPGLGLTFALRIVQEHQGSIVADSEPGKGTKFLITLPVQDLT